MILNDIELVAYLRGLQLFKNREFLISYYFLGNHYLDPTEKQILKDLDKEQKIQLFETNNGFLELVNKYSLSIPEASNIYYATSNTLPLVTKNKTIINICRSNNITTYQPCEALKLLNIGDEKIKFIQNIINNENIVKLKRA